MICVPVTAKTNDEAIRALERAAPAADVLELRIDGIMEPDLRRLLANRPRPVLVTNRSKMEGGVFEGSEARRCALLLEAAALGADMVDAELKSGRAFLGELAKAAEEGRGKTELIVSFHDLSGTPGKRRLRRIVEESREAGAHIVKVVTMAREMKDNLALLELVRWAHSPDRRIIGFCMGEKGKISRIAAPLFGSCMSYAALDGQSRTAPGQLTVGEMRDILNNLKEGSEFLVPGS